MLVGGAIFVNAAMTGATAFGVAGRDAALTMMLFQLTSVMTTMIGFAAALPLAAAGIGVLRTHLMPNWLTSVAAAYRPLGIFASTGTFVAGGFLMTGVPLLLSALWIACAGAYMVREHLPEMTTGEAAVPQM